MNPSLLGGRRWWSPQASYRRAAAIPPPKLEPAGPQPARGASTTGVSNGGGSSADGGAGSGEGGAGGVDDTCPRVKATVPPGTPLNVRPDPSTTNSPVGTLQSGQIVDRVATVMGEDIDGNDVWYEITAPYVSGFIFSGFAECTRDFPPEPPDGFYLPLECGKTATVSQGNNSAFSHNGSSAYAFDFSLGVGVPMVAMADGVVGFLHDDTGPGDPCYNGGDSSCINEANYVVVLHADDTQTQYAHLSEVLVTVGQTVARGEVLGLSGSTGWSTGRHAHVRARRPMRLRFLRLHPARVRRGRRPGNRRHGYLDELPRVKIGKASRRASSRTRGPAEPARPRNSPEGALVVLVQGDDPLRLDWPGLRAHPAGGP